MAVQRAGMGLTLCSFPDTDFIHTPWEAAQWVGGLGVDGLILNFGYDSPEKTIELLEQFKIPTVVINSDLVENSIAPDHAGIAKQVLRGLSERQYTSLLYIKPEKRVYHTHYSIAEREKSIAENAKVYGLDLQIFDIDELKNKPCSPLLSEAKKMAVLCYSHTTCMKTSMVLLREGVTLNEDLKLMYFADDRLYDQDLEQWMAPILLPEQEVGEQAVDMLMRRLEGGPQASCKINIGNEHLALLDVKVS